MDITAMPMKEYYKFSYLDSSSFEVFYFLCIKS